MAWNYTDNVSRYRSYGGTRALLFNRIYFKFSSAVTKNNIYIYPSMNTWGGYWISAKLWQELSRRLLCRIEPITVYLENHIQYVECYVKRRKQTNKQINKTSRKQSSRSEKFSPHLWERLFQSRTCTVRDFMCLFHITESNHII